MDIYMSINMYMCSFILIKQLFLFCTVWHDTSMYCFTVSLTISIIMGSNFCCKCVIFPMYRYFLFSSCIILACSVVDVFLIIFTYSSNNIFLIYFVMCRFLKYLELEKSCWIVLIWMDSAKGTYILVLVLLFSSFYSFFV